MAVSRFRPRGEATGTRGLQLEALVVAGRSYPIDRRGFLADPGCWDLQFAAAVASHLGQSGELTLLQLRVVLFVRRHFVRTGEVARVYATCRACRLSLGRLRRLFPWGYQRGVCRLAGIPYEVIDSSHHALTYETIARHEGDHEDPPPGSVPQQSGPADC